MIKTDYSAIVLADSVKENGSRITTFELTYPRWIHSEFMTHRSHARNASSSRAIPLKKTIKAVSESPSYPLYIHANVAGMQGKELLQDHDQVQVLNCISRMRNCCLEEVSKLEQLGVHKQIANRYLEAFGWITVIATANQLGWKNYFKLRCHPEAEPHMNLISGIIEENYYESHPELLLPEQWHLPLCNPLSSQNWEEDSKLPIKLQIKLSVARCARVSYTTHDGVRDIDKDLELYERIFTSGHWSPFEHQACPTAIPSMNTSGGCLGREWVQYRKLFTEEFPCLS